MNNEPAFPITLRDYFAAKALPSLQVQYMDLVMDDKVRPEDATKLLAEDAYALADAMLTARTQTPTK